MKSWKTTAAGVSALLVVLGHAGTAYFDSDPQTNPDWTVVLTGLTVFFGLVFARDKDVSDENQGVK